MEFYHPGVGTIVQSTWWVQCTHVFDINMAFHIQHQEGVHIYMHDTNIADGVEGEEIPRDTLVFVCRLRSSCSMVLFFYITIHIQDSVQHHRYHYYLIII